MRGSLPAPGPETSRVGGNTSCLEVRTSSGGRLILDAGTGIRRLGQYLGDSGGEGHVDLMLTHFHHDHIQGLPFFLPGAAATSTIQIHAPGQPGHSIESLVLDPMSGVHFPLPRDPIEAALDFHEVGDGTGPVDLTGSPVLDQVTVRATRMRHPSVTLGYRIDDGPVSMAYLPDNELVGGEYGADRAAWYAGLVGFLSGVDVLFHDAMYTDEEYGEHRGWGHSTMRQAIELAEDAGVGRLFLFHHAPDRTDGELQSLLEVLRAEITGRNSQLVLELAVEGREIVAG